MLKNKSFITTALIAAALVVAAPTFAVNYAGAFYSKTVQGGSFPVFAGTVNCPDRTIVSGAATSISAQINQKTGSVGGFYEVCSSSFACTSTQPVNKALISSNNFKLTGIVNFDTLCPSAVAPSTSSLSGPCGAGVTVEYADTIGVRATIPNVNVVCNG